jgi:excisionase family DNA binding protein
VDTETVETRWVPISDAVIASGLSYNTIRRRIADGTLNAERVGPRLIRIDATSLDALRVNIRGT